MRTHLSPAARLTYPVNRGSTVITAGAAVGAAVCVAQGGGVTGVMLSCEGWSAPSREKYVLIPVGGAHGLLVAGKSPLLKFTLPLARSAEMLLKDVCGPS